MTLREQLKRANPIVGSPTYRLLKGQISEKEYQRILEEERRKLGATDQRQAAAS